MTWKMTDADVGVDYEAMDPFKRLVQMAKPGMSNFISLIPDSVAFHKKIGCFKFGFRNVNCG